MLIRFKLYEPDPEPVKKPPGFWQLRGSDDTFNYLEADVESFDQIYECWPEAQPE